LLHQRKRACSKPCISTAPPRNSKKRQINKRRGTRRTVQRQRDLCASQHAQNKRCDALLFSKFTPITLDRSRTRTFTPPAFSRLLFFPKGCNCEKTPHLSLLFGSLFFFSDKHAHIHRHPRGPRQKTGLTDRKIVRTHACDANLFDFSWSSRKTRWTVAFRLRCRRRDGRKPHEPLRLQISVSALAVVNNKTLVREHFSLASNDMFFSGREYNSGRHPRVRVTTTDVNQTKSKTHNVMWGDSSNKCLRTRVHDTQSCQRRRTSTIEPKKKKEE